VRVPFFSSRVLTLLLTGSWLLALVPVVHGDSKTRPVLAGTWALDPVNSDSSSNAQQSGEGSGHKRPIFGPPRGGGGIGGGGPVGGAGMGGPMMRSRPDEDTVARSRELMRIASEPSRKLVISADGDALILTSDSGHHATLKTDGSKTFEVSEGGLELERKTKWDDEKLVAEIKAKGGGGEIKQVYTREGDRLIVESTVETDLSPRAVKLRHVYEKAED
jgi:hypothetical protein